MGSEALLDEATTYAHEQGALVIVSALGPVGFALSPPISTSDDFDRLARPVAGLLHFK
jgi:hypothetical protein